MPVPPPPPPGPHKNEQLTPKPIAVGTIVQILGLQDKAEYNGLLGECCGEFTGPSKRRIFVLADAFAEAG